MTQPSFRWKRFFQIFLLILTLVIIAFGGWLYQLNEEIITKLRAKRFAAPIEFYSAPEAIRLGNSLSVSTLLSEFSNLRYRQRQPEQTIMAEDYSLWPAEGCRGRLHLTDQGDELPETFHNQQQISRLAQCLVFGRGDPTGNSEVQTNVILLDGQEKVIGLYQGNEEDGYSAVPVVTLQPEIFAQFYGQEPILRKIVPLGKVPVVCLNALLAIEDAQFLEHKGVSLTGILRAFYRNLTQGRVAQGGSTITQQTVKNYFLTSERSFKRKITEVAMALLLEWRASKDEILETYVNLIYMGQNGSYQIRGFAAAARYYFEKEIQDLTLSDCALIAAVVNSPGLYNPFKRPEPTMKRRNFVLDRMVDVGFISAEENQKSKKDPLPQWKKENSLPAPFFVEAVMKQLRDLGIDSTHGLRVFTTLNPKFQRAAEESVLEGLQRVESSHKIIKELSRKGQVLEGALLAAEVSSGFVTALVGGRDYKRSQFNRALLGHRQVGSLMKPFVYLAALESVGDDGTPLTPLSRIYDGPTTVRYEGQVWKPKNYDNQYYGDIPLFFALKSSLNCATAVLAQKVGLSSIIDVARRLGITSPLEELPSLALGAFELYPWEILQAYLTMASLGKAQPLSYLTRVEDLDQKTIYSHQSVKEWQVAAETMASLVSMMKQTLETGTGRSARSMGFALPAAGKTGTTSDMRDAWFAGFTPDQVAVTWVGYDSNTGHQLTGASGALPLWVEYMKRIAPHLAGKDFEWPAGVTVKEMNSEEQISLGVPPASNGKPLDSVTLIIR